MNRRRLIRVIRVPECLRLYFYEKKYKRNVAEKRKIKGMSKHGEKTRERTMKLVLLPKKWGKNKKKKKKIK